MIIDIKLSCVLNKRHGFPNSTISFTVFNRRNYKTIKIKNYGKQNCKNNKIGQPK